MRIIIVISVLALVMGIISVRRGLLSGNVPPDLGVISGRLKAPSKTENSVSSQAELFSAQEFDVDYAKISALKFEGDGQAALAKLKQLISSDFTEATLVAENETYLRYEFKTNLMRFTDDVEFLLSEKENLIHFRSASRLGRKDLGKNRARMESIREKLAY